ncbi:DUF885 domain-containing protein [Kineosporia sp. R_H_3]|uniref:DUF885 domain-containing protein n=1 Tax=Kineosporia sp. R_H_3 TaxID=1961848 RepID=UPI0018EA30C1|nr:DUF885 domain-containing protein [Kineosporia sp. R_H_3]
MPSDAAVPTTAPGPGGASPAPATPREIADRYVRRLVAINPVLATSLGLPDRADEMPDFSPDGLAAEAAVRRETLAELDAAEAAAGGLAALDATERRCARLLRERLTASQALEEAGEQYRSLSTLFSPLHSTRQVFMLMPTATDDDWATVARRLGAVRGALASYRATLDLGRERGLLVGPAQVDTVLDQLGQWLGGGAPDGVPFFAGFAAKGPDVHRTALDTAAADADAGVTEFRDWLRDTYAPAAHADGRDPVGRERYRRAARYWTGSDLDLDEAYRWAWGEYARLDAEMRAEAGRVLPGATVREAMTWLDTDGPAIEGVEEVRQHLQGLMDTAIADLDGTHFDLAEEVRRVEAMIAPPGGAAAPYYTRPGIGFSRPGRTWLPTMGETRFSLWQLVSTWYHEGVPGHHLQLAQWVLVAPQLSLYQTSIGSVGANVEGWALYAERLMDELGYLTDPGARLGYLDAQQMRAVRVIIDIGMHLELEIPAAADQGVPVPFRPGERWTPAYGREFFGLNSGRPGDFLDSELVRYLGMPGQAISYKLGERAWLEGRAQARAAHEARGETFDAKAWHMAALSQGSLGLDDLVAELAAL